MKSCKQVIIAIILAAWSSQVCLAQVFTRHQLRTRDFVLTLDTNGKVTSLTETANRAEVVRASRVPFMILRRGKRAFPSTSLKYQQGLLTVGFTPANVSVVVRVEESAEWLDMEIQSISSDEFDHIEFSRIPISDFDSIGYRLNAVHIGQTSVCLLAGKPTTEATIVLRNQGNLVLGARAWKDFDLEGQRAYLIACPSGALRSRLENFERSLGLPLRTLEGRWAKDSPELRKGYLLCDPRSWKEYGAALDFAHEAGLGCVVLVSHVWTSSVGSYSILTSDFPGGIDGLRRAGSTARSRGVRLGLHCLAALIRKDDPIAKSPSGLKKEYVGMLSQELTTSSTALGLSSQLPTGGADLLIDSEFVKYTSAEKVLRGAYGSVPSRHPVGSKVWRMVEGNGLFLPDPRSDLISRIATRLANVCSTCDVGMIYFDGNEAMSAVGPAWYTLSLVYLAFAQAMESEIIVQGSGSGHYAWHILSRANCDDYVCIGISEYRKRHKVPRIQQFFAPSLETPDLGWWALLSHTPSYPATMPEDVNDLCATAAAWNGAVGLETNIRDLSSNARSPELAKLIGLWQSLYLKGNLSPSTNARLRKGDYGYRPVLVSGKVKLQPQQFFPERVFDSSIKTSGRWNLKADPGFRMLSGRIRALTVLSEYGAAENISLLDLEAGGTALVTSGSPDARAQAAVTTRVTRDRDGSKTLSLSMEPSPTGKQWVAGELAFPEALDLSHHRCLGCWIYSDSPESLQVDIQLLDSSGHKREHDVSVVAGRGWTYYRLDRPGTELLYDYPWPHDPKRSLRAFDYSQVKSLKLLLWSQRPTSAVVYIAGIEALAESTAKLERPSIVVDGATTEIPVSLCSDEYCEFSTDLSWRHYSANGRILGSGKISRGLELVSGANAVAFSSATKARALVQLRADGVPFDP